ncbi:MAG: hypothetical protein ACJ8HC_07085 [Paraburkholderia graminis]|uniref:hypothetical protein n=1 Tax=Paraburkholderia graminis TaxID=60548 RepID=UPI003899F86D
MAHGRCYCEIGDCATGVTRFGGRVMMEFFSPAVLAAILRVSSTPIFSLRLATASLLVRRDVPRSAIDAIDAVAMVDPVDARQRGNPAREDAIRG